MLSCQSSKFSVNINHYYIYNIIQYNKTIEFAFFY